MQYSNYHSHCDFCDGRSFPEDFVKFAIRNGFRAYGFSSHSPLPFETFWNMSKEDMNSIHYLPLQMPLEEENMMCIDGSYDAFKISTEEYYGGDIRKVVRHFYQSSCEMVEAGGFDVVGHLDKIYMNGQRFPGFSLDAEWYKKEFFNCLDLIQEKGLMVEVNTKNYVKKRELFPHQAFLKCLKERNIPVMVNSDCHYPDLVNDGREAAFDFLKEAGYKNTCELVKGVWREIALE